MITSDAHAYAVGLVCMSICVPKESKPEEIETVADALHPTGLNHGWSISKDKNFRTGETNPCVCESNPDRMHYLLNC